MGRESLVSLAKSYIICTIGLQIWARFLGGEKGSQWEWDQRPLPAAGSIGNSKKSITLHLCNLLLFIKHLHIPYLQKKKKKKLPSVSNTWEGMGSGEAGHIFKLDRFWRLGVMRTLKVPFLSTHPPKFPLISRSHQALYLQVKAFIPVKC